MRNLCRSSSAENSSSASGLIRPSCASARSAVRSRLVCSSRSNGDRLGRLLPLGDLTGPFDQHRGDQLVGAVLRHQGLGVEPELLERPLLELLDPHLLLGAGHLVAVHAVDQLVEVAAEVAHPLAGLAQLLLAAGACLLDPGALGGGGGDRLLQAREHDGRTASDRLAEATLALQLLAAGDGRGAGVALGLGRPEQGVGAAVECPGALLGRPQRQPRLHLGRPRRAGLLGQLLARSGVRLLVGSVLGAGQAGLELRQPLQVPVAGLLRSRDRLVEALRLGPRVAGRGAVLAELLRHRGQGRVGLVQLGQGHVDAPPRLLALRARGCEASKVSRSRRVRGRGQLLGRLVDGRLHLDQARLAE